MNTVNCSKSQCSKLEDEKGARRDNGGSKRASGLERMWGCGNDETAGEGRILTGLHSRYLGDSPLAHVAVKLVGVVEHCEERQDTRRD